MSEKENTTEETAFEFNENTTLKEAMAHIANNTKKGVRCPCCNGFVKLYKRSVNSSNAICLMEFFTISEKNGYRYYHLSELMDRSKKFSKLCNGGEFARMRHFGLIVEQPKSDMDRKKKTSGFWALTTKGKEFCQGKTKVRQYILLLNNNVLGFDGDLVTIKECLTEEFSYEGVMSETHVSESVSNSPNLKPQTELFPH